MEGASSSETLVYAYHTI